MQVQVIAPLGLTPSTDGDNSVGGHIFLSSDQYLASALFAGGQQLYSPSPVPFSYYGPEGNWSITPLKIRSQSLGGQGNTSTITGTLEVVTYGINTFANCQEASSIVFGDDGIVTATLSDCSISFVVLLNTTFTRWHFANSTQCSNDTDIAFKTFVSAVYGPPGYNESDPNQFDVTFCSPSISIAKVRATLSVSPAGIGSLVGPPVVLESYPIGSHTTDPQVRNLLGPPLNGRAVNGYDIAEPADTSLDSKTVRAQLAQEILFKGIYGAQLEYLGAGVQSAEPPDSWCTSPCSYIGSVMFI